MINAGDEIIDTIKEISMDKDLDESVLQKALEDTLVSAFKKLHGRVDGIEVNINEKGGIEAFIELEVVENVEEPDLEISLAEAGEIVPTAVLGDKVKKALSLKELSKGNILNIRTLLGQKIKEAEKERVLSEFKVKIGEIVSGQVQQVGKNSIIVDLGKSEGMLSGKDQILKERWHQGQRIKALIMDIQEKQKSPYVVLSRTSNDFLIKLFINEVPEIYEGIIKIMSVARDPGERAKISVSSKDERIDPVGACVGMKGSRVQSIVKELSGEKIDIVLWSSEPEVFISRALAPATIEKIKLDEQEKKAFVVVADDQYLLAIGKNGQNARLASKLTGWKIDISNITSVKETRRSDFLKKTTPDKLTTLTKKVIKALSKNYEDLLALNTATDEEILELKGVEEKDIPAIRKAIDEISEISEM
ncbi:transcription termination factor NusA [candidate division WOR-3 bacterium]|nr:transcription termination factor NusA [candidate division WOR-3 bacterium]